MSPSLRGILKTRATTTILQLQRMSSIWGREYRPLNVKAFRALTVLNDSEIINLVDDAIFRRERPRLELFLPKLEEYIMYGLFGIRISLARAHRQSK